MKWIVTLAALLFAGGAVYLAATTVPLASCTQQQAKTAVNIAVKVSDQLCVEEAADPAEPDWVKLACLVEGGVAHVAFPRTAWMAMHAAR
jgi:hypothetical protein